MLDQMPNFQMPRNLGGNLGGQGNFRGRIPNPNVKLPNARNGLRNKRWGGFRGSSHGSTHAPKAHRTMWSHQTQMLGYRAKRCGGDDSRSNEYSNGDIGTEP